MSYDRLLIPCLAATLALAVGPAAAREPQWVEPWPVDQKLLGKPKGDGSEAKKSTDVSGIACADACGFPVSA